MVSQCPRLRTNYGRLEGIEINKLSVLSSYLLKLCNFLNPREGRKCPRNIGRIGCLVFHVKMITLRLCNVTFLVIKLPAEIYCIRLHRVRCILMKGANEKNGRLMSYV